MDKETQRVVDKLDFFRDAIVLHHEYKTQDLIHWLAVAGDLIEELAGVKEQLVGTEIMLTVAQSAAETFERKYDEKVAELEQVTRERDALKADILRADSEAREMQWTLDHGYSAYDHDLYCELYDALNKVVAWEHKELLNDGVNEDGSN